MTSLSPGDGVPLTSPSSSPRHGRPNDLSFVSPSLSYTPPSLTLLIQRLVFLLSLTSPTSPDHRHLLTALDHPTTPALTLSPSLSSSSSPPSSPPLSPTSPAFTIRILTPVLPLSPR